MGKILSWVSTTNRPKTQAIPPQQHLIDTIRHTPPPTTNRGRDPYNPINIDTN